MRCRMRPLYEEVIDSGHDHRCYGAMEQMGKTAEAIFEKAEDQARAYQDSFGQWGFPFMGFPFMGFPLVRISYDPFGF
jgi:hypothetical protein